MTGSLLPTTSLNGAAAITVASAALKEFEACRLETCTVIRAANTIEGLPGLWRAHAAAIGGLAALHLHRIVGEPEPEDFLALRDDIEAIACIVDRLLQAIGAEAAAASHAVEQDLFEGQLAGTLEGNASYNLTEAAAQLRDEIQSPRTRIWR